ncbi:MAG TPA: hypothetical protein VGN18_05230 [Jatrophihabitans sp.]|jgi:hypothetical protein|uniref:hypothetical protein n=1 Tax=Jatrophihabitans sp. TaxID=1932789 RepID=UPI002E046E02|nr:hypothetical protein [Jatrophihabitans sp.]
MQAHAGHPRRARTCAAALLACLLTLSLVPVGAQASSRPHAHQHVARIAVVLPTLVADPGHLALHGAVHSAVLPGLSVAATAVAAWPVTADSSPTAKHRTAQTPPVRGPPAQGSA